MSRLKEFLSKLCPEGVPYEHLGGLATMRNGFTYSADKVMTRPYKVSRIETISGGTIHMDRVATLDKVNPSYKLREGDILFSHINSIQYLGNCAYYTEDVGELYHGMNLLDIRCSTDRLLPRFLFYYMHTYKWWLNIYRDAKHAVNQCSLSLSDMKKWLVPVPPIEVQREVVRMLDSFQELDVTLGEELEVREKQLEHYRDSIVLALADTEHIPLSSIGSFYSGLSGKTAKDFGKGSPFVTYMNVFTNAEVNPAQVQYVDLSDGKKQNQVHLGDILFTVSSETPDEAGMTSVVTLEPDEPTYLNSFCTGFRPKRSNSLDPNYMKHILRSYPMRVAISRCANGVTRFNISKPSLAKVGIPLPALNVQHRIAEQLDAMQALIVSIRAERDARREQYEYYRDKVLAFPERKG